MPLYAGVCAADITPPPGLWMAGYSPRLGPAIGVHDSLLASAVVADDGRNRIALVSADLISLPPDLVKLLKLTIGQRIGVPPSAVMLHCTHTHGGPYIGTFRGMGDRSTAYEEILGKKLVGITTQAASQMRPAHFTYGEAPAQIGVNRRKAAGAGSTAMGHNFAGPVSPIVQTLCLTGLDGRVFAMLFAHACHPTTLGGDNLLFTAEWPGMAAASLRNRFITEGPATGVERDALAIPLQGCCGDVNPLSRGSWQQCASNAQTVAEAAHTARWNSHGGLTDKVGFDERTVELPVLPPVPSDVATAAIDKWNETLEHDRAIGAPEGRIRFDLAHLDWAQDQLKQTAEQTVSTAVPFTVQRLDIGGVSILGFPAEMFVNYQLDFMQQSRSPVIALGYTNGCLNYLPAAADYGAGGYEVAEAYKYYASAMFAPESEQIVRSAAYDLLGISEPDLSPYPSASEQ